MKLLFSIVVIHALFHCIVCTSDKFVLKCNFERNNFCGWKNFDTVKQNTNNWIIKKKNTAKLADQKTNLYKNLTGKNFAYAQLNQLSKLAVLSSPKISCSSGIVKLSLNVYLLGNVKLQICHKGMSFASKKGQLMDCQVIVSEMNDSWITKNFVFASLDTVHQIFIRAHGLLSTDIAAVDDIFIQCSDSKRFRRDTLTQMQVITYENWARLKEKNATIGSIELRYGKPSVMLVVSDNFDETNTTAEPPNVATSPLTTTTVQSTVTTSTLSTTTITECNDVFCIEKESSEEISEVQKKASNLEKDHDEKNVTASNPKEALSNLAQWVQIIRNVAPVLPMIPSLINSFKNTNSLTSTATNADISVDPTMENVNAAQESIFDVEESVKRYHPSHQQTLPIVPVKNLQLEKKILRTVSVQHGQNGKSSSAADIHSPYEAPFYSENELKSDLNLSSLTVNELRTLESIHKKIFPALNNRKTQLTVNTSTPKPHRFGTSHKRIPSESSTVVETNTLSANSTVPRAKQQKSAVKSIPAATSGLRYLTPQMVQEINLISTLPYFDELTEGLDLTLVGKPGGFAILRKQVMERMLARGLYTGTEINQFINGSI